MPRELFADDFEFLRREMLLSFEEINRCVSSLIPLGVKKIRITGGEPLLRRDLANLVAILSDYNIDLALTTNGALLSKYARVLSKSGLNRVTVSLDALDEETFQNMNDVDLSVQQVLDGIDVASLAGLDVKVNCVVRRGINDHAILELVEYFRQTPHVLRFIEFMDVGMTNAWQLKEVVPAKEILSIIAEHYPLSVIKKSYRGEVATRYMFDDGMGEIGIISSVSNPFCGDCNRARISADGKLYTCLFSEKGHDLRKVLRSGAYDDEIQDFVKKIWNRREDRYSELREDLSGKTNRVEMSYIGG